MAQRNEETGRRGLNLKLKMTVRAALLGAALLLSTAFAAETITVPVGDSPSIGPASAPVTMIEFVDYQ
jgi:hypothetical protein